MKNKVIRCQDCYNKFIFTVKQQQTYSENGWQAPIRCPSCRARKKEIWATNENYKSLMSSCSTRKYSNPESNFFIK